LKTRKYEYILDTGLLRSAQQEAEQLQWDVLTVCKINGCFEDDLQLITKTLKSALEWMHVQNKC